MGAQFSEEFLLGYRAGHRDGFADAVLLMRDAVTPHPQARALARREAELAKLLSGEALGPEDRRAVTNRVTPGEPEGAMTAIRGLHRMGGHRASLGSELQTADGAPTLVLPERS